MISRAETTAESLLGAMHVSVGAACLVIAGVLLFDRAAATRAMFDNRLAFGGLVVLCGLDHFGALLTGHPAFERVACATMVASCGVSVAVAWLTLRAFLVKRAAPP